MNGVTSAASLRLPGLLRGPLATLRAGRGDLPRTDNLLALLLWKDEAQIAQVL